VKKIILQPIKKKLNEFYTPKSIKKIISVKLKYFINIADFVADPCFSKINKSKTKLI